MMDKRDVRKAAKATAWNPVEVLGKWGVRSSHAYTAGFASVGISLVLWLISRGRRDARADHWGLFTGQWAPTFFALGIALKHEKD